MRSRGLAYGAVATFASLIAFLVSGEIVSVRAERGHGFDRDRYYSPHWELDVRHRHDHFYPARGYVVPALPPGYLDLTFGGNHFFFRSGVWFRAQGPKFVVVQPPVAISQTGYDPAQSRADMGQRAGDFQRAVRTCLEGKGYTVN